MLILAQSTGQLMNEYYYSAYGAYGEVMYVYMFLCVYMNTLHGA